MPQTPGNAAASGGGTGGTGTSGTSGNTTGTTHNPNVVHLRGVPQPPTYLPTANLTAAEKTLVDTVNTALKKAYESETELYQLSLKKAITQDDHERRAMSSMLRFKAYSKEPGSTSWHNWKTHFLTLCAAQQLSETNKKQILLACMMDSAASIVSDLDPDSFMTFPEMLEAFEKWFQPPAASALSRIAYNKCVQAAEEDILTYHARLRELFRKAFPGEPWHSKQDLIYKFATGLRNKTVSRAVLRAQSTSYQDALNAAQNEAAVFYCHPDSSEVPPDGNGVEPMEIGSICAMNYPKNDRKPNFRPENSRCFLCKGTSHGVRFGPHLPACQKFLGNSSSFRGRQTNSYSAKRPLSGLHTNPNSSGSKGRKGLVA